MKLKIPNILTIGRIIIVPIFVITFFIPGFFGDLIPFFLFVLASFTDYLDGLLARLFKEESKLGEMLDPIADKILVCAALILLVMNETIKNYEVIAAVIILTREILVSGLREFLAKGKIAMEVTSLSKLKTFIQMAAIAILLTGANVFFKNKEGELHTPIPDSFLDGITRREVIKIAKSKGIKVIERKIKPEEMNEFVGCFLTGTAAEITPVSQISNYNFKVCDVISDLNDAYQNLVRKGIDHAINEDNKD